MQVWFYLDTKELQFNSMEDFFTWKEEEEERTNSFYIQSTGTDNFYFSPHLAICTLIRRCKKCATGKEQRYTLSLDNSRARYIINFVSLK